MVLTLTERDFWGRPRKDLTPRVASSAHHREIVEPLTETLRSVKGLGRLDFPRVPLVDVPENYSSHGSITRVHLPATIDFHVDFKSAVVRIVKSRLGISDLTVSWNETGQCPFVDFTPKPPPPPSVALWDDYRDYIFRGTATAPIIGMSSQGNVVTADLEADSPHILISSGSGGGKSILTAGIVSQGMHHGAKAIFLDFKRNSHKWARGLPGVVYARTIPEIHDALVAIGAEGERRNVAADDPTTFLGPRIYVVFEEMNATMDLLTEYWNEIRERADPKRSPAVTGFRNVVFMGRSVGINGIAIAQLLTARTIGGPEMRENFATRCLARFTANACKMLIPEVRPIPRPTSIAGRWTVVKNGEAYATQVLYAPDETYRRWAMNGVAHAIADSVVPGIAVAQQPETLSLTAAMRVVPNIAVSIDALRKAAQRPGFPRPITTQGQTYLYKLSDLRIWSETR
jgi:hypothetical protein